MGDRATMQQLPEPKKKRIEWMELMTEFIPDLYRKIGAKKKERQKSYLQILDHIQKINPVKKVKGGSAALEQIKQSNDGHYSEAKAEAEKYIKADRKWIALKEIEKQCQKIEDDVSFHDKPESWIEDNNDPKSVSVASVIYAFKYCENELREDVRTRRGTEDVGTRRRPEDVGTRRRPEDVRKRLIEYFGDKFVLNVEEATRLMTSEIEEKLLGGKRDPQKGKKVTSDDMRKMVEKVAKDNGVILPKSL